MGNNAISDSVFYKSAMSKMLAFITLKSNIAQSHNVVCPHIIVVRLFNIALKIHISNRYNFICSEAQIVLFGDLLILIPELTLFPSISTSI